MPRKTAKRTHPKVKKQSPPLSLFSYRRVVIIVSAFIISLTLFAFSRTQAFYFLTTTKEKVNFENQTGEYDATASVAYFHDQMLPIPEKSLLVSKPISENATAVLGDTSSKRIEIDLTNQRLYAIENGTRVYDFPISSGKPWWATPTGTFRIWIFLRYTRMTGGSKSLGTYYDLPNVPYTMFFFNDQVPKWKGYGIHGAYWHNNFGHPMSHGCVNMREADVAQIYYWAKPSGPESMTLSDPYTQSPEVIIYGSTPSN